MSAKRAFTLIELMITVSIIGILAALAIPRYEAFLIRAKRAELPMNVDAIRTCETGYHAEWDVFTSCEITPSEIPGRVAVPFPANETTSFDWNQLGWVPDGKVYGQYQVIASDLFGYAATFEANGFGDVDGDGNLSHYQASQAHKPWMLTPNIVY